MNKLLVCDMAGTTVKDNGRVARCFHQALVEYGAPASEESMRAHMGRGKLDTIKALLGEHQAGDCFGRFRTILEESYRTNPAEPMEDVETMLQWVKSKGHPISLNTGFYRKVANIILDTLGWVESGLVDSVICDDDVSQGRPAPYMIFRSMEAHGIYDVRDVAYVGDTTSDMASGRNAMVKLNMGVLSGGETPEALYKAGANAVVPSAIILIKLLPW